MKKLATLALAVTALSFTFNFISCSGGSGSSSDSGSYDSESEETTSGSSSGTSSTGSGSGNTSTGSGSGSGSTGSGSGNTSTGSGSTSTGSGTVSGAALPAGSIQLLSYSSSDLNNKVFSYEDEEDVTRYLGFSGGRCYKSSNPNSFSKTKDYDIIKYNSKLYRGFCFPRTSGSGLFATFSAEDEDGQISVTFNNSGSIAVSENGRHTGNFTFTNNNGELSVTIPGEGNNKWCYDGSKIYGIEERLTYYGSFPR